MERERLKCEATGHRNAVPAVGIRGNRGNRRELPAVDASAADQTQIKPGKAKKIKPVVKPKSAGSDTAAGDHKP